MLYRVASPQPSRVFLVLNFVLVYLFWGSTYLGIDIAVERIPPALMCAVRFTVAGLLMLAYCLVSGKSVRYGARELAQLAVVGVLLLMGGNLTLCYAERHIPTGLAALLIASTPLWFLLLDSLMLGHHRISGRGLAGLGLGLLGTLLLLWPKLTATGPVGREQFWWSVGLLLGAFCWAFGSILSKKWQSGAPQFAATGWQVLFAGLANFVLALLHRDFGQAVWTARGIGAVVYLIVGGSLIGYTAYIYILGHAPTAKVSTYAYVNPVVAVFLGWLVLHETIDRYILAGSAIIVASVLLVSSASVTRKIERLQTADAVAD